MAYHQVMTFHIQGLDPAPFADLFALPDTELAARGIARRIADEEPGYPCRVSLRYAAVGDELLLLPYEHVASPRSPYRARGPIYVRRGAARFAATGVLPDALARARLLSVRAYDHADLLADADVVPPSDAPGRFAAMLADPAIAYLHAHYAGPGCFACRVDRG